MLILKYFAADLPIMQSVPRVIRWIFSVALFFFVLMLLLRVAAWVAFAPPALHAADAISSFWLGFRYDAREVGAVCLLLLITGMLLNPFTQKAGRVLTFSILGIFLAALIILRC